MKILAKALLGASVVAITLVGTVQPAAAEYRNHYGHQVESVTLGAQFNYGISTGDGYDDLDPYGAGLGLRGGYTFPIGLYLGGDFDYFFGEGRSVGVAGIAAVDAHVHVYDFMAEVGYDFWVHEHGILRPKLGLGVGIGKVSGCGNVNVIGIGGGGCTGDSDSGLSLGIGLQYLHFFDNIFLNLEGRYQTISIDGPNPSAIVLGIGVGVAL